ncbi:MAG TPA: hypothetical protein VK588_08865 [Chitinophagaceae bacterium]|nr:hypothetical protein [Chitinophagaceae bacterium]
MPNRSTDALFQLVKSLEKSEKRNFKLYVKRNSSGEDLKIVKLFDALDKSSVYDEEHLLKKNKSIKKQQLSNIKAHLYKQILSSLRLIKDENNIDIQLHEQMDHARILFNKGLYLQSLKVLDKMKEMARSNNQLTYLQQALFFEKKIEGLFITRSMQQKADELSKESDETNCQLSLINRLSNLSLQLYGWYITHGHARSTGEMDDLKKFLEDNLPEVTKNAQGFYERLYLYQCYCWYAFIRQDFLQYYRYTQKWVDLFAEYPNMHEIETAHYIKGMHNLMGAHFDLRNAKKLQESIEEFEKFSHRKVVKENHINYVLVFVYLTTARINIHFLEGSFSEGLKQVPLIEEKLKEYELYIDRHRILVFYYKIACLYFGAGKNEKAIQYLSKIINWKVDLRTDLQCYARLLHLIAHYELGNFDLLQYLTKSVYRFMAKMKSLSAVEEEMFLFLRHSFQVNAHALKPEFENLLEKLKKYETNSLETRAFSYLDVISWLESKIHNMRVQDVIREKYLHSKNKVIQ